jgi:hypothetical protein
LKRRAPQVERKCELSPFSSYIFAKLTLRFEKDWMIRFLDQIGQGDSLRTVVLPKDGGEPFTAGDQLKPPER